MACALSFDCGGFSRSAFVRHSEAPELAVLLLHPAASMGRAMAVTGGWTRHRNLSLLAPDGLSLFADQERSTTNPSCWSSEDGPTKGRQVDDVAFIDECLGRFLAQVPPDVPLAVVGHSNGCGVAFRLLSQSSYRERFLAASLFGAHWAAQRSKVSLPILYFNGDSDLIRPFHGGSEVHTPWFSYTPTPVMETVQACLEALGGDRSVPAVELHEHWTGMRWLSQTADFELRILRSQGHHWPTGSPLDESSRAVLGPSNPDLNATAMTLEFFQRVTRQRSLLAA